MALLLMGAAVGSAAAETPREHCAVATTDASRTAAIEACDRALVQRPGAEDLWAAAHVRLARPEPPTVDDLVRADLLATAAARVEPTQPWGALARLELARRWGDPALVAREREKLERLAPAHPATQPAIASVRPHLPLALMIGWTLLLAACVATLVDALRRRGVRVARARAAALVVVAAVTLFGRPAAAAFVIDDADPVRTVPSRADADRSPMEFAYYLQDLSDRALGAERRGDRAATVRYYRAMARAVPDSSVPQQKLCAALQANGEADDAMVACRAALGLAGVHAADFVRFGDLVLARPTASAADLADVEAAARHLVEQPDSRVLGLQLECRLAVRRSDLGTLASCSRELATRAPGDPSTWVFAWTLATKQGKRDEARGFIARARAAGLAPDAVARLESAGAHDASWRKPILIGGAGLGAVVFASLLLRRRRRATAPSRAPA